MISMHTLQALGDHVVLGNTVADWAHALAIFVVLLTVLPFVRLVLARRLRALGPAHRSATGLELAIALIERTTRLFILAISAYLALKSVDLPHRVDRVIDIAIQVAIWMQVALWGVEAARFAIERRMRRVGGPQLPTFTILRFVSLVLVWALALLMLLSNLGVNITALVTSLGIGGVAFALAIQNVLGDVLASLAIALDKPFQIGDELHFGDIVGTVEQIGIKSTRLRSIDGEQIIIANAQLLTTQLRNFGRAREQRILLVLSLAFDTPSETLRTFPELIERVVQALPASRLARCYLRGLGGNGLEFEVSFFATAPAQTPVSELRQQFMLRLLEQLRSVNLTFSSSGTIVPVKRTAPATAQQATV
jgi:MscS family membrane protein